MTYAEAVTAAQRGKRVTHSGLNRGWCMRWEGKSLLYVDPLSGKSIACKIDDSEKSRTDWEIVT